MSASITTNLSALADFHFLRPMWWWALLPLCALWWWQRTQLQSGSWREVVDSRLLPYLLVGVDKQQRHRSLILAMGGVLAIAALAGPAWQKIEQPVFSRQSALVVILDLSRSMDAADIKPSRLQRVKLKLRDILRARTEGETALIVFAAQPFVVSPLTSDAHTIESQLESLTTDLMPEQGSRIDRALQLSQQLLEQAGATRGGVLLLTDGLSDESTELDTTIAAAQHLSAAHFSLSILGAGTEQGAPIALGLGGFLKDANGNIVLPGLHDAPLERIAQQAGGVYRRLSSDDNDWQALLAPLERLSIDEGAVKPENTMNSQFVSDAWRDEGPWLLLPLLLLSMFAFRRGIVFGLLVVFVSMQPQLVRAAEAEQSSNWQRWWFNKDQRAQRALEAQQPQQAAELFQNPAWRAAAHYRANDYSSALKDLQGVQGNDAAYNRGNALAQMGKYQEALKSYDEVLKRDPNHADAKFNRDLVSKLLQDSQNKQGGQQSSDQKPSQSDSSKDSKDQGQQDQSQGKNQQSQSKQDQSAQQANHQQDQQRQSSEAQSEAQKEQQKEQQKSQQDSQQGKSAAEEKQAQKQAQDQAKKESEQDKSQRDAAANDTKMGLKDKSEQRAGDNKVNVSSAQDDKKLDKQSEQLLRRVPDDPGGLWRKKFQTQYQKQQGRGAGKESEGAKPW